MKLLFLGTGTSHGVPMIGCECAVCRSPDPRNQRSRSSALITLGDRIVLVDAGAELRVRALAIGLRRLDAVLITHPHADHVSGLDDLRAFTHSRSEPLPVFAAPATAAALRQQFAYIFDGSAYPGVPNLALREITGPFDLFGHLACPITLPHGERFSVTAFRIGPLGYVTDASEAPLASRDHLRGLDVLVLNALRHRPHPAHLTLDEALEIVADLKPRRAFFTHIAHDLDHAATNALLPPGVALAHDGLEVTLDERLAIETSVMDTRS